MHDLISFPLMCEAHEIWYVLTTVDDDTVKVNVKIERRLRNMTTRPQEIDPSLDIDEWGFIEKSVIHRCELRDTNHIL